MKSLEIFFFGGIWFFLSLVGILKSRSEFTFDAGIHRESIDFLRVCCGVSLMCLWP